MPTSIRMNAMLGLVMTESSLMRQVGSTVWTLQVGGIQDMICLIV
jgi:hypothetical protein